MASLTEVNTCMKSLMCTMDQKVIVSSKKIGTVIERHIQYHYYASTVVAKANGGDCDRKEHKSNWVSLQWEMADVQ